MTANFYLNSLRVGPIANDLFFSQQRTISQLIEANVTLDEINERLPTEGFALFPTDGHKFKTMRDHYRKFIDGTFDWQSEENSLSGLNNALFCNFQWCSLRIDYIFLDTRALQLLFPIEIMQKYLESGYYRYGYSLYDEQMKFKSVMVSLINQVHLNADFRFHLRISTQNIKTMNFFLRCHIREANKNDPYLRKKYLSSSFNIKAHVRQLLEMYFINVTWRYIGGGVHTHRHILYQIRLLFELGFWEYNELPELMNHISAQLENLLKLESATIVDVKSKKLDSWPNYIFGMARLLNKCRIEVVKICIQAIMLCNDHAMQNSLNLTKQDDSHKFKDLLQGSFMYDLSLGNTIYNILSMFLMSKVKIQDEIQDLTDSKKQELKQDEEQFQKNFIEVFQFITNGETDSLIISNRLVEQSDVDFFTISTPEKFKDMMKVRSMKLALESVFDTLKCVDSQKDEKVEVVCKQLLSVLTLINSEVNKALSISREAKDQLCKCMGVQNIQMILLSIAVVAQEHLQSENSKVPRDCIVMPLTLIWDISNNKIGQTILLNNECWDVLELILDRTPLLAVLLIEKVYATRQDSLNLPNSIFEKFLLIYKRVINDTTKTLFPEGHFDIDEIFKDLGVGNLKYNNQHTVELSIFVNNLTSAVIYNRFFGKIVDTSKESTDGSRYFDLSIQAVINELYTEGLLPYILRNGDILQSGRGLIAKPALDIGNTQDIMSFSNKGNYTETELKSLIFDFSCSIQKLLGKCTSRLYFGAWHSKISKELKSDINIDSFGYLVNLEKGLVQRKSFIRMKTNVLIFHSNHCVTKYEQQLRLTEHSDFVQTMLKTEISPWDAYNLIKNEIDFVEKWAEKHYKPDDAELHTQLRLYVYENIFPLIYKYVKGIICLITTSNISISSSSSYIEDVLDYMTKLKDKLNQFILKLRSEYKQEAYISHEEGFKNIFKRVKDKKQEETDPLLDANAKKSDQQSDSKPKESAKAESDPSEKLFGGASIEADGNKEYDEILVPKLKALRGECKSICRTIESSYPNELLHYIESFDRLTALKRKKNALDDIFPKKVYTKKKKYVDEESVLDKISKVESILNSYKSDNYLKFKAVAQAYEMKKDIWARKDKDSNSFYRYIYYNNSSALKFLQFAYNSCIDKLTFDFNKVEKSTFATLNTEEIKQWMERDFVIRKVLFGEEALGFIIFIETICERVNDVRIQFFSDILENESKKRFVVTIVNIFYQFLCFNFYKTFHDELYFRLTRVCDKIVDVLVSFSADNNIWMKNLISRVGVDAKTPVSLADKEIICRLSCFMDRLLQQTEVVYLKNQNYCSMVERPESYNLPASVIRIMSETFTGPHIESQSLVYNYSLDKVTMILYRIINDINSPFYVLKQEMANYVIALTEDINDLREGEAETMFDSRQKYNKEKISREEMHSRIIQSISSNFKVEILENQIITLIKKLFIYVKFKKSPGFKRSLISKLKEDLNDIKQKLIDKEKKSMAKNANANVSKDDLYNINKLSGAKRARKVQEINIKISKLETLDSYINDFEDKEAVILEEMESIVHLSDYNKLIEFYKCNPDFSNHPIMKLCMDLQKIILNLSKHNEAFRGRRLILIQNMYSFFGDQVPQDMLRQVDVTGLERLDESLAGEDDVVFMFLAQITQSVEVNIGHSEGGESKTISFQVSPLSMFLSNESKLDFYTTVEPEESIEQLMNKVPHYMIELKFTRELMIQSKTLFYLCRHDSLSTQKYIIWYLTLILNFLLVYSARTNENGEFYFHVIPQEVFTIYSLVIIAYSLIQLCFWFYGRYRLSVLLAKEVLLRRLGKRRMRFADYIRVYILDPMLKKTFFQLIFHIAFSLLGILWNPFFYTLHLLLLLMISETAYFVLRSITTHAKQLVITFLLAIFIIYIFAYLSFLEYNKIWDGQVDEDGTIEMCTDLWECMFYVTDLGLRNGGGIGDAHTVTAAHNNEAPFIGKFFFNIIFFIMINIISLNIIFGIIIDTFASIRDEQARKQEAYSSMCVVCHRSKEDIEKDPSSHGFDFHVHEQHSIWKYLNFILYLKSKDKNDMSGVEHLIYEKLDEAEWMPNNQVEEETNPVETVTEALETQSELITDLVNKFADQEKKLDELKSLIEKSTPNTKTTEEK